MHKCCTCNADLFDFVFLCPVNHVTLSFTDFDLEMITSNCSHDAVDILDGDNYQAPSIGNLDLCVFVCVERTPEHITVCWQWSGKNDPACNMIPYWAEFGWV